MGKNNGNKKSVSKIVIVLIILFLAVLVTITLVKAKSDGSSKKNENLNSNKPIAEEKEQDSKEEGSTEKDSTEQGSKEEDIKKEEESQKEEDKSNNNDVKMAGYINKLLKFGLKYPENWSIEENGEEILRVLNETPNGNNFKLEIDTLKEAAKVTDFMANDNKDTKISLSIEPFLVEGATGITDKVTSLNDIVNNELLEKMDNELKEKAEEEGDSFKNFIPSVAKTIGDYKVIVTEYGKTSKSGEFYHITKMIIPIGANNLVLQGSAKAGESSIDKYSVMEKVVESLEIAK